MYFSLFHNLPLEKGGPPPFQQTWIPFIQGWFVSSLVEIGPLVLERKMKMWKVYNYIGDDWQRTNCDQKRLKRLNKSWLTPFFPFLLPKIFTRKSVKIKHKFLSPNCNLMSISANATFIWSSATLHALVFIPCKSGFNNLWRDAAKLIGP